MSYRIRESKGWYRNIKIHLLTPESILRKEVQMFCAGKSIDLFEYAMEMLFSAKGYGKVSHLDVMGRRCFGFCNRRDGKGFYVPIINIEEAVKAISYSMHLREKLISYCPQTEEELIASAEEGIVYGPVEGELAVRRIRNLYYHGNNRFLYMKKNPDGVFEVMDPDGFPKLRCTENEIRSLFCGRDGRIICLKKNNGRFQQIANAENIWQSGWEFHRRISDSSLDSDVYCRNFESYDGSSSTQITLMCGVMNFMQHMEKIYCLKKELGRDKGNDSFRDLLCDMLEASEHGEVGKLPQIEAAIWKELAHEV